MNNTLVDVNTHHYTKSDFRHYVYNDQRICLYLKGENNSFIDSLDIDYMTGRIRFYGCMKDYDITAIPKHKKKLWNCKNFRQLIIEKLTNALTSSTGWRTKLYQESLDSIVNNCIV